MKLIEYEINTGQKNMERDENLLNEAIANASTEPILRLYGWRPACISLGRNQTNNFIDSSYVKSTGIDCVRRLTGGRALFHDNELTYSYITPTSIIKNGQSVSESYKYISGLWIDVFKTLGINLTIGGAKKYITKNNYCMSISTGADLCYDGKKFIGSAQCRKNDYILQHGSIPIDYNKPLIKNLFNEQTDFSNIITLHEINKDLTIEDIINAVKILVKA